MDLKNIFIPKHNPINFASLTVWLDLTWCPFDPWLHPKTNIRCLCIIWDNIPEPEKGPHKDQHNFLAINRSVTGEFPALSITWARLSSEIPVDRIAIPEASLLFPGSISVHPPPPPQCLTLFACFPIAYSAFHVPCLYLTRFTHFLETTARVYHPRVSGWRWWRIVPLRCYCYYLNFCFIVTCRHKHKSTCLHCHSLSHSATAVP